MPGKRKKPAVYLGQNVFHALPVLLLLLNRHFLLGDLYYLLRTEIELAFLSRIFPLQLVPEAFRTTTIVGAYDGVGRLVCCV